MKSTTSRIALAAAMAIGVAVGIAGPSFADVTVSASIDKIKVVTVIENISITKVINIDVTAVVESLGAAEAQALANVDNFGNITQLENVVYDADLSDSIIENIGITQANQASGNNQNQGNLVSAAVTATGDAFANSQAEVDQQNGEGNNGEGNGNFLNITDSSMTSTISGSLDGNSGIVQFNQDSGNNNNQTNAVAIAAGVDTDEQDVVASLSEAALGQANSGHFISEGGESSGDAVFKTADINNSMNGNTGVVMGVNQAAGNNANQANLVSVSAFVDLGGAQ